MKTLVLLFAAASFALMNLEISTPAGGSQPFTVGQAFRKGDVPGGTAITASISQFQADVRNRWSDNSVRFAVLSGIAPAGIITINAGGTPYSAADVAEPAIEAVVAFTSVTDASGGSVGGGSFSASLSAARANGLAAWSRTTPHKVRQIPGPVMSEFHYFVPTPDAHTHVWFYVRAYSTGQTEVETVVENGWLMVASPGRRNYNVTVTVGNTQRYSGSVAHYHHTRWSRADWIGTDPQVTPKHDVAYFQSANLVPTFAVAAMSSTAYTTLPQNGTKFSQYTRAMGEQPVPFSAANFDANLGAGGDTDMYGILPGWGATYFVEGHAGAFWSCVANGRGQGRYCLHYRDERDGRPFRGSANLTTGLNGDSDPHGLSEISGSWPVGVPQPLGGYLAKWTFTHSPAAAYSAAVLTGRWLFGEEVRFAAGTAEMEQSMAYNGYRVLAWWQQNRGNGWKARDRFQAEAVTPRCLNGAELASGPDFDQRAEAAGRVAAMIDQHYDYYISGTATSAPVCARGNAFGLPYQNADFDFVGSPNNDNEHGYGGLQNGIYIASWLYGFDMEPDIPQASETKLQSLAGFFGKFPVGMLGAAPNGSAWDWRVFGFVTLGFGTPGALTPGDDAGGRTVYRASWDANWARIQSGAPYTWDAGTFPLPAGDKILRKIQLHESTGNLMLSVRSTFTADTDLEALCWAANYAHKVADRANISGADTAIARLHGSDTWKNGVANLFRERAEFAITTDRFPSGSAIRRIPTPAAPAEVAVFPNPCRVGGKVRLASGGSVLAAVYNLGGQRIPALPAGGEWKTSGLPAGLYFVKVKTDSRTFVRKILLED